MNNMEKIEVLKLAVQVVINDKSASIHLAPGTKQGDKTTDLVSTVYKSLLATLTESA
jgi:hypothetical protein